MPIKPEHLDELLAGYEKPEDLLGEDGLFKQLKKALLERALGAELTHHLGYEKGDPAGRGTGNNRNGTSAKTVLTEDGSVEIEVPRDRNGSFEPQIVPKGETRLDGFDDKIISLYARGMTVREIQGHLRELYAVDVSPDLISRVTDAVLDEVREWQNRPLDTVYPVVFFDALRVKIRDESVVKNKAVYLALALDCEGHKHVLGLWIEQTEGAKFWLRVMNELKNRGVEDIIFAVVDGLKGFPDAITATFPRTTVQTCIVHLIRNSLSFVSWHDRRLLLPALRAIYRAETAEVAELRLADLEAEWGKKYPAIAPAWRRVWTEVTPFFAYPPQIRKMIYTTDEIDKRLCVRRGIFLARATSWRSAARRLEAPPGALLLPCLVRALAHSFAGGSRFPPRDEPGVVALGLLGDLHLLVTQRLDVVGIGWSAPVALCLRLAGLKFHGAGLVGDQRRARPQVIFVLGQEMPAQNSELARNGNGSDLVTSPGADADEEGMKGPSRPGRRPSRFDQHGTGMATPDLADTAVMSGTQPGLPYPWVQAKVADEFPRALEPADIANCGHESSSDREVDACDCHQPLDCLVVEGALGDLAIEDVQVVCKPVKFAHMPLDCATFIVGHRLACQPRPAAGAEQICMRALRDQVRVQDRVNLVLETGAMPHDLVASGCQPTFALGDGVRRPDLRQVACCMQACQRPRVDLVGLDVGMGDRLDLQGVGDDHPRNEPRQYARDRHAVPGGFDHHLVGWAEAIAQTLERRPSHVDPTGVP